MFERYTEMARRTIFFARVEAGTTGSSFIESEHLLLALLRDSPQIFTHLLPEGATAEVLRLKLSSSFPEPSSSVSTCVDLPLSRASKTILAYAAEDAESLGDRHIGAEHILLGIMRNENAASQFLATQGITRAVVESAIRQKQTAAKSEGAEILAETNRHLHGHIITIVERASLSEDGKSLTYSIDVKGPGKQRHFEVPFDLS